MCFSKEWRGEFRKETKKSVVLKKCLQGKGN